ncbi:MAG: rRNA maturation RNase YbeY [Phycisphaerales bacterium]|nr:rRNA maturation RNase YbeY [Phycisphaerales bacterium]
MPHRTQTERNDDPEPHRGLVLTCSDRVGLLSTKEAGWLVEQFAAVGVELGLAGEVRATLIDDAAMAAAHERWGGVPGTTDVLTFNLAEPGESRVDADVLIGAEVARRMASARGIAPAREVLLYLVHAVLHCAGHDDHEEGAYRAMHAEEDRILRAIGVGETFALPPEDGR